MSFCSPTTGSGLPRTSAENNATCSNFRPVAISRTGKRGSKGYRINTEIAIHPLELMLDAEVEAVDARPCEEVGVCRISRDAPAVKQGNAAVDQGDLRLGENARLGHELHVAHRSSAADREIENSRSDSAAEQAALEGAAARVRDVEDRLVQHGLDVQPGRREPELPPRVAGGVDAGIDCRTRFVEAKGGPCSAG